MNRSDFRGEIYLRAHGACFCSVMGIGPSNRTVNSGNIAWQF